MCNLQKLWLHHQRSALTSETGGQWGGEAGCPSTQILDIHPYFSSNTSHLLVIQSNLARTFQISTISPALLGATCTRKQTCASYEREKRVGDETVRVYASPLVSKSVGAILNTEIPEHRGPKDPAMQSQNAEHRTGCWRSRWRWTGLGPRPQGAEAVAGSERYHAAFGY